MVSGGSFVYWHNNECSHYGFLMQKRSVYISDNYIAALMIHVQTSLISCPLWFHVCVNQRFYVLRHLVKSCCDRHTGGSVQDCVFSTSTCCMVFDDIKLLRSEVVDPKSRTWIKLTVKVWFIVEWFCSGRWSREIVAEQARVETGMRLVDGGWRGLQRNGEPGMNSRPACHPVDKCYPGHENLCQHNWCIINFWMSK